MYVRDATQRIERKKRRGMTINPKLENLTEREKNVFEKPGEMKLSRWDDGGWVCVTEGLGRHATLLKCGMFPRDASHG